MVTQYANEPFKVFTMDDVFTEDEITNFKQYVIGQLTTPTRNFTNSDFLNGKIVNKDISRLIYTRIQPYLPNAYQNTWQFVGSIDTIMCAQVNAGKQFGIHTDTGCEYDTKNNRFSKFTVLIYLNDDFEGGHTTFYSQTFKELFKVAPKRGRVLCFDIDEFHKGEMVTKGIKLWIGTELVCTPK